MKNLFVVTLLIYVGAAAQASNNKEQVQAWTKDLPMVTSLKGDLGCEAVSFPKEAGSEIIDMKLGNQLTQGWLGLNGRVQLNATSLSQDYSGGGIDSSQFHFQLQLKKSGNRLISVQYRYYQVTGFIFKKEVLRKKFDCATN